MSSLHRACQICGESNNIGILKRMKFAIPASYKIQSEYDIVCCKNCGYCYADTLSTMADYDYYYSEYNFYSVSMADISFNHLFRQRVIEELEQFLDEKYRICDVGFGNADLLLELKTRGFPFLYGVDPSSKSVAYAVQRGIEARLGTVYKIQDVIPQKMDVMILTDVLEHLIRPSFALENLSACMEYGGYLAVTVPNCENLRFDDSPISNNFNQEHINYFSVKSLKKMMEKNGFSCKKIVEDKAYVDIFAIFQYKAQEIEDCADEVDHITQNAIQEYVQRQEKKIGQYNEKIRPYFGRKILIWGTGAFAMYLLSNSELQKCEILGFVDNNPLKNQISMYGKDVMLPECVNSLDGVDAIIVCCARDSECISLQIEKMGWSKEIVLL